MFVLRKKRDIVDLTSKARAQFNAAKTVAEVDDSVVDQVIDEFLAETTRDGEVFRAGLRRLTQSGAFYEAQYGAVMAMLIAILMQHGEMEIEIDLPLAKYWFEIEPVSPDGRIIKLRGGVDELEQG